jgi:cytochrome P450
VYGESSHNFHFLIYKQIKTMDPFITATALILLTLFYVVWRSIRRRLEAKKPLDGFPMPPNSHWLFGHTLIFPHGLFQDPGLVVDYTNENGQVGVWLVSRPAIVVTHYEDARAILSAEYARRPPPIVSKHLHFFLGEKNIGLLQGREWKLHRSAVYRSLGPTSLTQSRQAMIDVATTLVTSLKTRMHSERFVELDVQPLMKMVTIDIFAKTTLSTDLECCLHLTTSPIARAFDFLLQELNLRVASPLNPLNYFYNLPTLRNRRHLKERTLLRSFLAKLIRERLENRPDTRKDLLSQLLEAHRDLPPGEPGKQDTLVSNQALSDTLMSLLFAGYDTTSITLTYALYKLSQNPEIESLCVEEIASLPDDYSSTPNNELAYCHAVLYETLRMYPPA